MIVIRLIMRKMGRVLLVSVNILFVNIVIKSEDVIIVL